MLVRDESSVLARRGHVWRKGSLFVENWILECEGSEVDVVGVNSAGAGLHGVSKTVNKLDWI